MSKKIGLRQIAEPTPGYRKAFDQVMGLLEKWSENNGDNEYAISPGEAAAALCSGVALAVHALDGEASEDQVLAMFTQNYRSTIDWYIRHTTKPDAEDIISTSRH